ncbi:MAG: alpha/beta fold hydrolase [Planctomycetes bacterium]|nr:alpha/beta fold hydrolase [Planctomycetota bacterium]
MKKIMCLTQSIILIIILSPSITFCFQQQNQANDRLLGLWHAKAEVSNDPGVVLNFSKNADGNYIGLLTTTDGLHESNLDNISFKEDTFQFDVPNMGVTIKGTFAEAGVIVNSLLIIRENKIPMKFKRLDDVPWEKRPQTPAEPYPYNEEDVVYENRNAGIKIAGTITLPQTKGPFPVVLLISGSGPQDRNEATFGHQPFLILADHLTRNGIAVLRVDDRGVWQSTGEFKSATMIDFASDVHAGIDYLKSRKDIDSNQIGLIGHSEGGMVAPLVASETSDVNYIVMMNAPSKHLFDADVLAAQKELAGKAAGDSDAKIKVQADWEISFFNAIKAEKDAASAEKVILEKFNSLDKEEKMLLGTTEDKIKGKIKYSLSPWFEYYLSCDQSATLEKVSCPILAVYGDKDTQCPSKVNISALKEAMAKGSNDNYLAKELPGHNHMLQTAMTGAESEYSKITETISPAALELITQWILDLVAKTNLSISPN